MVNTELETYLKDTHKKLSGKVCVARVVAAPNACSWTSG